MLPSGTVLEKRYEIRRQLGAGGMGAVYLAFDQRLKSQVAVKENSHTDPRQFEQEAQLLFQLVHPNLPRVIDHFSEPGELQYLVMDYIDGQDLESLVGERGLPSEMQVRAWFNQILDAVAYLHSRSIIHRDIKPANIRLTAEGRAVLVDFGIAKVLTPGQTTMTGAKQVGSSGYCSPEQYRGGTDTRSDIYALGATMYAALTGTPPPDAYARERGSALLVAPRVLNPVLSPQLEAVILKALQVKPGDRFQSAGEMKQSLASQPMTPFATASLDATVGNEQHANAAALSGSVVTAPLAPPRGIPERAHPRPRRTWWVVAALALFVVLGGAAAFAIGSQFIGAPSGQTASVVNTLTPAPTLQAIVPSTATASPTPPPPTPTQTPLPTSTPDFTATAAVDATRVGFLFQQTVNAQISATAIIQNYNATQTALAPTATYTASPTPIPPTRVPPTRVPPTAVPTAIPTQPPTATPPRSIFPIRLNSPAPGEAFGNPAEAPFLQWTPATNGELASNEFYRIQTSHGGAPICNIYTKTTFYPLPPSGAAGEGCNPSQWQFNTGDWIWRVSFVQRVDGDVSHDVEFINSEGRLFKWNCDGKFC